MHLSILSPVRNDWVPAQKLYAELDRELAQAGHSATLYFVDDGSDEPPPPTNTFPRGQAIHELKILRLVTRRGHQFAITHGLRQLVQDQAVGAGTLVLDADGEDRPADAMRLLQTASGGENTVVVAERKRRARAWPFRLSHHLFRALFLLATGKRLNFGNFLFLPAETIPSLLLSRESQTHLAASVLHSSWPKVAVRIDRGPRYAGHSRMRADQLVLHGLRALWIFRARALLHLSATTLLALWLFY